MQPIQDIAIGSFEAAAVMGVHFTRPARMAQSGHIVCRQLESYCSDDSLRQQLFYSFADCDADYHRYMEAFNAAGGKTERRPRSCLGDRREALRRLSKVTPILYDDAIGTADAVKVLEVHPSLIHRWCATGRIACRSPWNPRSEQGRGLIISRRSCEELRQSLLKRRSAR